MSTPLASEFAGITIVAAPAASAVAADVYVPETPGADSVTDPLGAESPVAVVRLTLTESDWLAGIEFEAGETVTVVEAAATFSVTGDEAADAA